MKRNSRIFALAALTVGMVLGLAAVAIGSPAGEGTAAEHNADRGCVKSGPPHVHGASITRHSVKVSIWYNDTCAVPAKSFVEFAMRHNENWHRRARENTNPTSQTYWRERVIEITG